MREFLFRNLSPGVPRFKTASHSLPGTMDGHLETPIVHLRTDAPLHFFGFQARHNTRTRITICRSSNSATWRIKDYPHRSLKKC